MDKIAFFYNLGYEMALKKIANIEIEVPIPITVSDELREIGDAVLGRNRGNMGYLKNLMKVYGRQRLLTKILAPTIPLSVIGGLGYAIYEMARPKPLTERIRRTWKLIT